VHAMKNMVDDAVQEATTLYDFEDEDEVVAWHNRKRNVTGAIAPANSF
jgi:uncharacterized protein (UPF0264 family)